MSKMPRQPRVRVRDKVYDINRKDQPPLNPNGKVERIIYDGAGHKEIVVKFHDDRFSKRTRVIFQMEEMGIHWSEAFGWMIPECNQGENDGPAEKNRSDGGGQETDRAGSEERHETVSVRNAGKHVILRG